MGQRESNLISVDGDHLKIIIIVLSFIASIGTVLWQAAAWKTSIEDHLQRIEDHMTNEDQHIEAIQQKIQSYPNQESHP